MMTEYEIVIRLAAFLAIFSVMALLESNWPRRQRSQSLSRRWLTNWAIVVVDSICLRILAIMLPLLAVGAAIDAEIAGTGLFNLINWPPVLELVFAVLILDFIIWGQHLVTHKVPFLWRVHQVHHADVDIDVSTAIRFHPIEVALSMLVKIGAVYILGPSVWAVILFEILLNGTAIFNHANLRIANWLDGLLRLILVTPDMHRVHHSVHRSEHDSNYGFALSLWDRLFGTYIAQPKDGHNEMQTGLNWRDDSSTRLGWSLWLPFKKQSNNK